MKKLAILLTAVMFLLTFTTVKADSRKKAELKSEIKSNRENLKTERKQLRKTDESVVSDLSKDNFYGDFGNVASLKWTKTDNFDVASFMQNGKDIKAFYDYNSNLVGTTSIKAFADLPMIAQKTIKKDYKKYRIGDVIYFADNQDNDTNMILWDTEFDDANSYFVELRNPKHHIILQVNPEGDVSFFKQL